MKIKQKAAYESHKKGAGFFGGECSQYNLLRVRGPYTWDGDYMVSQRGREGGGEVGGVSCSHGMLFMTI